MKKIVCSNYVINSKRVPVSFDNYKIVMLSDMHDNVYGLDLDMLYRMIDEQRPDLVIFAGDLLTRKHSDGSDKVIGFLSRITQKYTVCFANGNHETKVNIYREKYGDTYDRLIFALKKIHVKVLNNDSTEIRKNDESIYVHGLEIDKDFFNICRKPAMQPEYIENLIGKKAEGFSILIAHNPMYFENYAAWGADLIFSGHVHGGIIRLPLLGGVVNPDYRLFPKYDAGKYEIGSSTMILGRGLGTHTINFRINNPPDLVIATLHHNENL